MQLAGLFSELSKRWAAVDTLAFIETYRPQILHPRRGWIVFEPYDYQREIIALLDAEESLAVNKARQIGISTAVMIQRLAQCLHPRSTIVVTNKQDTAAELVRIARDALERCDPAPPVRLTTDNTLDLRFDTGGRIKAESASQNPGRSYAASCIVLDELAYWPWQQKMWRAVSPAIALGGCSVAASTPDMEGDKFDEVCRDARLESSRRHYLELPWKRCPEYGDEWYAQRRSEYTAAEFASEFECQFGHAADAVFSPEFVARAVALAETDGRPARNPVHAIGGDLAGEGQSQTALIVLEMSRRPVTVVDAMAWDVLPAPSLQREIEKAAEKYGADPWLDETGIGWGILQNLGVRAIGVTITGGHAVTKAPKRIGTAYHPRTIAGKHEPNPTPIQQRGWHIPRTILINNLVLGLEQEQIAIDRRFEGLIQGLRNFRWGKRITPGADHVFGLAIAWWSATHGPQRHGRAAVSQRQPIGYV